MFWLVDLDLFSLECNEGSSSEFWGVYGLDMALDSLFLMLRAVFLLCWRISMAYLTLELVGSWVELGFSVEMEAFVWVLVYYCSLESAGLWCFQVLELNLLPLALSLSFTVASRLLHPFSTDDRTSQLMVKPFSTVRDTQRGSQSYIEKRRGRREIDVTRRRRGGVKRGETNLASNQFPKCSPQPRTPREFNRVT